MTAFFAYMKTAALQVAILYVLVLVGFICDKTKLFTEEASKRTIDLLLYIVTPCMIINAFLEMEATPRIVQRFFYSLALMFLTHFIAILMNLLFFHGKDEQNPVFKYASIYGNVGFMGLPLAQAVIGAEGVLYCTSGLIAFNVITFIHGFKMMGGSQYHLNIKSLLTNPGILSVVIGLPLFLLKIKLPTVIAEPISLVAGLNAPVAMIIFGTYLSHTNLLTMFLEKRIYLVAFLKLIVLPLICIFGYRFIGVKGSLLVACTITACVPSGNNTFMFASKFHKDAGKASQIVALVSVFSIITMPVMIALAQTIH